MKNRLMALFAALLMALGMSLLGASPAHAVAPPTSNSVENGAFSNINLLVCGSPYGCQTVQPGYISWQYDTWNPTQVYVGDFQSIIWRARVGSYPYLDNWTTLRGPAWLNVGAIQAYLGGNDVHVQIIANDPR